MCFYQNHHNFFPEICLASCIKNIFFQKFLNFLEKLQGSTFSNFCRKFLSELRFFLKGAQASAFQSECWGIPSFPKGPLRLNPTDKNVGGRSFSRKFRTYQFPGRIGNNSTGFKIEPEFWKNHQWNTIWKCWQHFLKTENLTKIPGIFLIILLKVLWLLKFWSNYLNIFYVNINRNISYLF